MSIFWHQVETVSKLKHDNFVELLGYCVEGNFRLLSYEFATMGSLHDVLHGTMISSQSILYYLYDRIISFGQA